MKRIAVVVLSLFVIFAPPVAVAQQEHRLYLAQIINDQPRIVEALGPCPDPLECVQGSGVGYP